MTIASLAPLILLAAPLLGEDDPPRTEIDLNGTWKYQPSSEFELGNVPESGDWWLFQVPGTRVGYDYERAWFRREFVLPANLRGKRIMIQFDGVKYNSQVYVNGQHVGGCLNGYDAFEVDATDAVRFGETNQLAVGCYDWTGVFSEGKVDFSNKPDWQRPRRYVEDKVIAPIGGHYDHYGIWGDVRLVAHPEVHVADLFIKPSVRRKELVVDYTLANESTDPVEVKLTGFVEDHRSDVLQLPVVPVIVPAGGSVTVTLRQPWPDAHYWSHEDPYLYFLRSELSTGDVRRTRFGFREFWIEGHRYVLNGSKINLLASSWWPPTEPVQREEVAETWRALKQAGVICFRTHTQPWRRVHYDVADEVGLLMIIEGAMWHDPYCTAYDEPAYWYNYSRMIRAMIAREKNRPSVIMWSMENEAYAGKEKTELAVKNLARVGRMAKIWDPTRPIYFESDGDPGGVADAIGMHYVHEYPQYTCWPNEAYWLDKPCEPHTWFGMTGEPFLWQREKPLYLGEFLWVPSGTPAAHTVFFGDDAYRDLDVYTRKSKAEAWKMQILAFRDQEVGGMCPWTVGTDLTEDNPLYRAHQYAYKHIAAYCLDYDRRFFGGERVERRVTVFNDMLTSARLVVAWTLADGDQVVDRGRRQLQLDAGEKERMTVLLNIPSVTARTPLQWRVVVQRDGETAFEEVHEYCAFPKLPLPAPSATIGLYEPNGSATATILQDSHIAFRRIGSMEKITDEIDVLIIAPAAIGSEEHRAPVVGRRDPRRDALMRFVSRGGRVLVLRQPAYPEGLFGVMPSSQESTMAFPLRPSHPALAGLQSEDLKFWRGDNLVTSNELPRPATGAAVSIVTSGSKTGIAHAPLLERPEGSGCILHCQMLLIEKMNSEPAARRILGNVLSYLSDYHPAERKTAVVGGDSVYRTWLKGLGLQFEHFADGINGVQLNDYSLVILRGDAALDGPRSVALQKFVERGGQLLVHRPTKEIMESLQPTFDIDLEAQPYSGSISRGEGDDPALEMLTREDLYWTVKQPGLSWARQPRSSNMADGVLGRRFAASGVKRYEIETWNVEGAYVRASADSVLFASAGTAVGEIEFAESGSYAIGVRARGTPCKGIYPEIQISIDARPIGSVQLDGDGWAEIGTFGHVARGNHTVTVAFVNDQSDPPREDRNLEVDAVLVGRDQRPADLTFLTSPPAVVMVRRGKGRMVFDRLRWDTEVDNGQKAARYACSLLTSLGADFTPRPSVTLQCEQMTPEPGMNYYDSRGGVAYMGCNGYIKTDIDVAHTARYRIEVLASGDDSDGICPLVELHVDGRKVGQIQLTTEGWRSYPLELQLTEGQHEFSLHFVNDYSSPTGDRNLRLDKVEFYDAVQ